MTKKRQIYEFISGSASPVSKEDIAARMQAGNVPVSDQYLTLVLHELLSESSVERVGRGRYAPVTGIPREVFIPETDPATAYLHDVLCKGFPAETFCIWNSAGVISRLIDIILPHKTVVIECRKEVTDEAWRYLIGKSGGNVIYGRPGKNHLRTSTDTESIVIQPLISGSPLHEMKGFKAPKLEKILVDLISSPCFEYLTEDHIKLIWRNAFSDFTVSENAVLRYAGRRNKEGKVMGIMNGLSLRPKRLSLFNDWLTQPHYEIPQYLLWDYDLDAAHINWENMKTLIAERVMTRGDEKDWYALLQRYGGKDNVADIVKQIIKIGPAHSRFGMLVLGIYEKDMLCLNRHEPDWRKENEGLYRNSGFRNL